jgi:hypothetical protein
MINARVMLALLPVILGVSPTTAGQQDCRTTLPISCPETPDASNIDAQTVKMSQGTPTPPERAVSGVEGGRLGGYPRGIHVIVTAATA